MGFAVTRFRVAVGFRDSREKREHHRRTHAAAAFHRSRSDRKGGWFVLGARHAKPNGSGADNCGMKCMACRKGSVSRGARLGTKYCSSACRAMAYRERHKAERSAQRKETQNVTAEGNTHDAATITEKRTEKRTQNERKTHKKRPVPADEKSNEPALSRKARVAFSDQLRKQQPEGATGYRLVLPTRNASDMPRIVPGPDSQGGIRYWRIDPFEIADDIRLQEGLCYRVLWVDATGQPLAPTTPYVPSLSFFLGPPDNEKDERNAAYEAILRDVHDPVLRQTLEAEVARSRLALQRERERQEIHERQTLDEERLCQIESTLIEEQRRRAREDLAEAERILEQRQAEQERQRVAREARDEREMWRAFMVMGGVALTAALGWGPFTRWLDSLQNSQAGDGSKKQLAPSLFEALTGLASAWSKTHKVPDGITSHAEGSKPQKPETKPPSEPTAPTAPSEPSVPAESRTTVGMAGGTPAMNQSIVSAENGTRATQKEPRDRFDDISNEHIDSLDRDAIKEICACALDSHMVIELMLYSRRKAATKNGQEVQIAFDGWLDKAEVKRLRAIVTNPHYIAAFLQISKLLDRAKMGGAEAMFCLPKPLPSLTKEDRKLTHKYLETDEQEEYFHYLMECQSARLEEQPMPPAQALRLSWDDQKVIRRLSRDRRTLFYIVERILCEEAPPRS